MLSELLRALLFSLSCLATFGFNASPPIEPRLDREFLTRFQIQSFSEISYPQEKGGLKISQIRKVLREKMPHSKASHIKRLAIRFHELCVQHRFDPAFILAVIEIESAFNPKAVSHMGARGLMQVMPATAEYVADRHGLRFLHHDELFDPFTNLRLGILYLVELRGRFDSVVPHFLAAYNAGPGTVEKILARPPQTVHRPGQLTRYVQDVLRALPNYRLVFDHV